MLAEAISDEQIIHIAEKLPSAPRLLVQLEQLLERPRCDVGDIAGLLNQDPALIAQILRMANSPAYSPAEKIGHLDQALSMIGFAEVHRLLGAIASRQIAEQQMRLHAVAADQLRLNTLYVAVLMEELADAAEENPRRCYTVGMLRTLGMMALEHLAPPGHGIPAFPDSGHRKVLDWERENWGLTHVEVTEKILLHWNFPHETVQAIRHHCEPGRRHNPVIHLLMLAATAAADRFGAIPGEAPYWDPGFNTLAKAGVDTHRYRIARERAARKFERLKIAIG